AAIECHGAREQPHSPLLAIARQNVGPARQFVRGFLRLRLVSETRVRERDQKEAVPLGAAVARLLERALRLVQGLSWMSGREQEACHRVAGDRRLVRSTRTLAGRSRLKLPQRLIRAAPVCALDCQVEMASEAPRRIA